MWSENELYYIYAGPPGVRASSCPLLYGSRAWMGTDGTGIVVDDAALPGPLARRFLSPVADTTSAATDKKRALLLRQEATDRETVAAYGSGT